MSAGQTSAPICMGRSEEGALATSKKVCHPNGAAGDLQGTHKPAPPHVLLATVSKNHKPRTSMAEKLTSRPRTLSSCASSNTRRQQKPPTAGRVGGLGRAVCGWHAQTRQGSWHCKAWCSQHHWCCRWNVKVPFCLQRPRGNASNHCPLLPHPSVAAAPGPRHTFQTPWCSSCQSL